MLERIAKFGIGLLILGSVATSVLAQDQRVDVKTTVNVEASTGGKSRVGISVEEQSRLKLLRQQELRKKLVEIKDQRKKKAVQTISERMCSLRDKRVEAFNHQLQTMITLLNRAEAKGADATSVSKAKTAIATAQTAVNDFATLPCGLTISGDEQRLGLEAKGAASEFHSQVAIVHDKIVLARKAVSEAIRSMARALGEPLPAPVKEFRLLPTPSPKVQI